MCFSEIPETACSNIKPLLASQCFKRRINECISNSHLETAVAAVDAVASAAACAGTSAAVCSGRLKIQD